MERTLNVAREGVAIIEEAVSSGRLSVPRMEAGWIERMRESLEVCASLDGGRADYYGAMYPGKFLPAEYGL
jgi:hypothetical protein